MSRRLPTKAEALEKNIHLLDQQLRTQLKLCSDENQILLERNESLLQQVSLLRRENEQLRERLHLPERRYEARAPPTFRSSSLEYEPERTLRF